MSKPNKSIDYVKAKSDNNECENSFIPDNLCAKCGENLITNSQSCPYFRLKNNLCNCCENCKLDCACDYDKTK